VICWVIPPIGQQQVQPEAPAPAAPPEAVPHLQQAFPPLPPVQVPVQQEVPPVEVPPVPVEPAPPVDIPQPQEIKIPVSDWVLHEKKSIDYNELHTGVKRKCWSLQRKSKAVIAKLARGSFLPKQESPSTSR
jgi:hypothetical protein